ncbi:retrovirus-related pol polyprotein from transposon TNT 1-94 [Tanacetum coccineum]
MASEGTFVQPSIPRFDGQYEHWTARVTGNKLKDLKAKNYLFQAIDRSILETILNKATSKDIWDSMKKKYQGSTRARRQQLQALRSEFDTIRMKPDEPVSDYFSQVMAIVNKMRIHGDKTEGVTVIEKILRSLTTKFNFVVCAIEESKDVDELSLDELQSSLMVHEQKFKQPDSEERALKVSTDHSMTSKRSGGRGSSSHNLGGRGRGQGRSNRGRGRGRGGNFQPQHHGNRFHDNGRGRGDFHRTPDKSSIECYRCHKFGHYSNECRTNLGTTQREINCAENEVPQDEILLLMASCEIQTTNKNVWYLDTGCSNHMSGDKTLFSALDESFRDSVWFGNDTKVFVLGKGEATVVMEHNGTHNMSSVLYVPDLKTNLLSIGQLQEKGYEISIFTYRNIKEIAKLRGSEDLWEVAKLHDREASFPPRVCPQP